MKSTRATETRRFRLRVGRGVWGCEVWGVGLEECESDGDASPTRRMAEAVSTRQRASRTAEGVSNTPSSVLYTADGVLGTGKWKIRKRKRNTSHDETKPRGERERQRHGSRFWPPEGIPHARCRANMEHLRRPRPHSGLGFQVKCVEPFPLCSGVSGLEERESDGDNYGLRQAIP